MTPRYARKVDSTQAQIVETLRAHGCLVLVVNGVFDLLVYRPEERLDWSGWRLHMIDCKGPTTRKTAAQQQLERDGWPLVYLNSAEAARRWIDAAC